MTTPAYIEAHSPRVGLSRVGGDCVSRPVQGARGRAFQISPVIIGEPHVMHIAKVLTSIRKTGRGFGLGAFPDFPTGWCALPRQPGRVSAVLSLSAPRHNSKARQHGAAEMAALQQLKLIEARNEFSDGQSHGGRGGMDRARTDGGVND